MLIKKHPMISVYYNVDTALLDNDDNLKQNDAALPYHFGASR